MKELALEISNKFPFSPVPPQTDERGNVIVLESGLDKDFMERLERGEHLDFPIDRPDDNDKWPF